MRSTNGNALTAVFSMQMTVETALRIQAEQCAHYEVHHPGITAYVAEHTDAAALEPGRLYPVQTINRYIPRGGRIEALLGLPDMGGL